MASASVPEAQDEPLIGGDSGDGPGSRKSTNFLRQYRDAGSLHQFQRFTASQFMEIWNHYDTDGNGYIEGSELDDFLLEFVSSVNTTDVGPEVISATAMEHLKRTFLDAFDDNQDEKIDISELANILPTDENFLLLFRRDNPLESSVEFMKVWRQFDKNCSGQIDADELKSFLKHLLHEAKPASAVSEEKIEEYTSTMLNLFDVNKDGQLQLSEMARLLPVKMNYLSQPFLKGASRMTKRDIDKVFDIYDKDRNGTIENDELAGFLKDLIELVNKDYTREDIDIIKAAILAQWDVNRDGRINKSELRMLLLQQLQLAGGGGDSLSEPEED